MQFVWNMALQMRKFPHISYVFRLYNHETFHTYVAMVYWYSYNMKSITLVATYVCMCIFLISITLFISQPIYVCVCMHMHIHVCLKAQHVKQTLHIKSHNCDIIWSHYLYDSATPLRSKYQNNAIYIDHSLQHTRQRHKRWLCVQLVMIPNDVWWLASQLLVALIGLLDIINVW